MHFVQAFALIMLAYILLALKDAPLNACVLRWGGGGMGGAFHFLKTFHFVEIQSIYYIYLQNDLDFFN